MAILFKFLHVAAAMVWVGGALALVVINTRLSRSKNRAVMEAMAEQAMFYGQFVLGPAMALTLLAGIATAGSMGIRFSALWILWGFGGILLSLILGAVFIRRTTVAISRLSAAGAPDTTALAGLQHRLAALNLINLLLLISVIAAMVFKPVL